MSGDRTIIGSESDDTRKIDLDKAQNNKVTIPVTIYDASGNQVSLASGLVPKTYDSIALSYTSGNLTKVVYSLANVVVTTLTLTYDSSNNVTTVTKL